LQGQLVWREFLKEVPIPRTPRSLSARFNKHIKPSLNSFEGLIDAELTDRLADFIHESGTPPESKDRPKVMDLDASTDDLPFQTPAWEPLSRRLQYEADDAEIDIISFTPETQGFFSYKKGDNSFDEMGKNARSEAEKRANADEINDSAASFTIATSMCPGPRLNDLAFSPGFRNPYVTGGQNQSDLEMMDNSVLDESSAELSQLPISQRERKESAESVEIRLDKNANHIPTMEFKKTTQASVKKRPRQAENLEQVAEELSKYYRISNKAAWEALKKSRYSVRSAICRILRSRK